MGGLTGSAGGLTPEQQKQLQAMLKATKAPASTIPANLFALGTVPQRSSALSLARDARMTVLQRQGYKATVKTGPLGDAGFGTSLSKPVLTGQAA